MTNRPRGALLSKGAGKPNGRGVGYNRTWVGPWGPTKVRVSCHLPCVGAWDWRGCPLWEWALVLAAPHQSGLHRVKDLFQVTRGGTKAESLGDTGDI